MTTRYGWIALGIFSMSSVAFAQQTPKDPHLTDQQIRACIKLENQVAKAYPQLTNSKPSPDDDAQFAKFLADLGSRSPGCAAEVKYQVAHMFDWLTRNDDSDDQASTGQGRATAQSSTGNRTSSTSQTVNRSPAVLGQAAPASQGAAPASGSCGPESRATCAIDHEAETN